MTEQEKNAIEEAFAENLKKVFGALKDNLLAANGDADKVRAAEDAFKNAVALARDTKARALKLL